MDVHKWLDWYEFVAALGPRRDGTPHVVACFTCAQWAKTPIVLPFVTADARDGWHLAHYRLTGHTASRFDFDADGIPVEVPEAPRVGGSGTAPGV